MYSMPFKYYKDASRDVPKCPLCEAGFKTFPMGQMITVRDISDPKKEKWVAMSHGLLEKVRTFCSYSNDPTVGPVTDIKVDRINNTISFTVLKRKGDNNEKS